MNKFLHGTNEGIDLNQFYDKLVSISPHLFNH